jgi:hypothetical protein
MDINNPQNTDEHNNNNNNSELLLHLNTDPVTLLAGTQYVLFEFIKLYPQHTYSCSLFILNFILLPYCLCCCPIYWPSIFGQ